MGKKRIAPRLAFVRRLGDHGPGESITLRLPEQTRWLDQRFSHAALRQFTTNYLLHIEDGIGSIAATPAACQTTRRCPRAPGLSETAANSALAMTCVFADAAPLLSVGDIQTGADLPGVQPLGTFRRAWMARFKHQDLNNTGLFAEGSLGVSLPSEGRLL